MAALQEFDCSVEEVYSNGDFQIRMKDLTKPENPMEYAVISWEKAKKNVVIVGLDEPVQLGMFFKWSVTPEGSTFYFRTEHWTVAELAAIEEQVKEWAILLEDEGG